MDYSVAETTLHCIDNSGKWTQKSSKNMEIRSAQEIV